MSNTRAKVDYDKCDIVSYVIPSGKTTVAGYPVKISTTGVEKIAATTDEAIGIALDTCAATATCRVALWGQGRVKALVGTAGATAGKYAKYASDGLVDGTVGGGTTNVQFCGQFLETAAVGEFASLNLGAFTAGVGS